MTRVPILETFDSTAFFCSYNLFSSSYWCFFIRFRIVFVSWRGPCSCLRIVFCSSILTRVSLLQRVYVKFYSTFVSSLYSYYCLLSLVHHPFYKRVGIPKTLIRGLVVATIIPAAATPTYTCSWYCELSSSKHKSKGKLYAIMCNSYSNPTLIWHPPATS